MAPYRATSSGKTAGVFIAVMALIFVLDCRGTLDPDAARSRRQGSHMASSFLQDATRNSWKAIQIPDVRRVFWCELARDDARRLRAQPGPPVTHQVNTHYGTR